MQQLEGVLNALFVKLQWQNDSEAIELASEALTQLAELQDQEILLSEIF